jgi:hypothetical protein
MSKNVQKQIQPHYRAQTKGTKINSSFGQPTNLNKSRKDYIKVFKKSQQNGQG